MVLTEKDRGRTVEVDSGGVLTLHLNEKPGTGYRWAVVSAEGLNKIDDHFEAGAVIGGIGLRVIRFQAPRKGLHEVRLNNWREWEGEGSIVERFSVQIKVR